MSMIYRKYVDALLEDGKASLLQAMEAPLRYLEDLKECDDWSFVIKVQALIEGRLAQLLTCFIGEARASRLIERLPLSDDEIGKISLGKELGLLSPAQRRFIRKLAELRNRLAHRPEYTKFDFDGYLKTLNSVQLKDWRESLPWFSVGTDGVQVWGENAINRPRTTLWLAAYLLLAHMGISEAERRMSEGLRDGVMKSAEDFFGTSAGRSGDDS